MEVITVRQGGKFPEAYTRMLRKMTQEYCDKDLLVLGDGPDADIRLRYGYEGCWAKLELFSPELEPYRPFFFLDLDTYLLDRIDDILEADPIYLVLIRDFYNPGRANSGLMIIPKDTDEIWQNAQGACDRFNSQDGNFLNTQRHSIAQNYFDGIKSYKKDQLYTEPSGRIVCFHGKPKPHATEGWAKEIWTKYAA